jgi:hypothetical protein
MDAVTSEGLRGAIPAPAIAGPVRPFTECVAQPSGAGVDFAVGELTLFAAS